MGGLVYLHTCTLPDITFSVNVLSRLVKAPLDMHCTAAKCISRYSVGPSGHGSTIGEVKNDEISMLGTVPGC